MSFYCCLCSLYLLGNHDAFEEALYMYLHSTTIPMPHQVLSSHMIIAWNRSTILTINKRPHTVFSFLFYCPKMALRAPKLASSTLQINPLSVHTVGIVTSFIAVFLLSVIIHTVVLRHRVDCYLSRLYIHSIGEFIP